MKKNAVAYAVVDMPGGWGVGACREGEKGYHPVPAYGPYEGDNGETRAQGIVDRLNERAGHGPHETFGHKRAVRRIVGSTMPKSMPSAVDVAELAEQFYFASLPRHVGNRQTLRFEDQNTEDWMRVARLAYKLGARPEIRKAKKRKVA